MKQDKEVAFLAGMHRSGTSLLHEILRDHPQVSGFVHTGVPEDEGQHLQSVYLPAKAFGGPGRFAFHPEAYMDETHELATYRNSAKLLREWGPHCDLSKRYLIEKSPPNIVRTRFLQELFPRSRFVIILRHPVAVAYATKRKWPTTDIGASLDHSLRSYEILFRDLERIRHAAVLRYEDFVSRPQEHVDWLFAFLGLPSITIRHDISTDINRRYFKLWEKDRDSLQNFFLIRKVERLEKRANSFGYSFHHCDELGKMRPPCLMFRGRRNAVESEAAC